MSNPAFFEFIDCHQRETFKTWKVSGWLHNFAGVTWDSHFSHLFRGGEFDLSETNLIRSAQTAPGPDKTAQSVSNTVIGINQDDAPDARMLLMDQLDVANGERMLDVGCNLGMVTRYLASRGANSMGVDVDPKIVEAARILSNFLGGVPPRFECGDIESDVVLGDFDTIVLFSVLSDFVDVHETARRLSAVCRRALVASRLEEQGAKFQGESWRQATRWRHDNVGSLVDGLTRMFDGFQASNILGPTDDGQYVMELVRA